MSIWKMLAAIAAAYLLGSISTGILLSRAAGVDIRAVGSKNAGASNVLRVLGKRMGVLTFLGDFAKTAAGIGVGYWLGGREGAMIAALAAVVGHNWPVFFHFRGGKGVAGSTAVMLLIFPLEGAIAILLCLAVIWRTRYISAGSLTMFTVFFALTLALNGLWPVGAWSFALLALGFYRHRSNIERLRNGTENKLGAKPTAGV